MAYCPRLVDPLLDELLSELPAVLLVGPRASGKTTTALRHAASIVRLDREAEAVAFRADPDAALRCLDEPVLLDEWQAVPAVLGAVKRAIDANSHPGRYLLTGSVRAEMEAETWPGTGRLVRVTMHPLTMGEIRGHAPRPLADRVVDGEDLVAADDTPDLLGYVAWALRGGFPEAVLGRSDRARRHWLRSYVEHIVTRDAPAVEGRRDPVRLGRYFEAYALNTAGLAEEKTIYDAARINRKTATAYKRLLGNLMVIDDVRAWTSNRLTRLTLSPKHYLVDASLLDGAIGVEPAAVLRDGDLLGRVLDTFVAAHLRAEAAVARTRPRLHHLRQERGRHEVDLVLELDGRRVLGVEIKASSAPSRQDARHLRWLRDRIGERFVAGVLLHTGPATYSLGERITAAPISTLWA
ncbi:MAG: ATP-binding protein [Planctomycetota bacterium]